MLQAEEEAHQRLDDLLRRADAAATTSNPDAIMDGPSSQVRTMAKKNKRLSEREQDEQILREEMSESDGIPRLVIQPAVIKNGVLKDYQLDGLNWLIRLYELNINGILADEMGLGKTLQSISLLAYIRQFKKIKGPHLIVVPKSTLGNWMAEIQKWCPEMKPFRFHGDKEERVNHISSFSGG